MVERYHPSAKFPPEFFCPDQSGSNSSASHYRDYSGRTLSLPRRHEFEDEDFQRGDRPRDHPSHRSSGGRNGTFSLGGTLRRNHSSSHFNTTFEDDVFEDSISAPNSAKPLLHDQKPSFPHLYSRSPYDPFDSSSSSRSRSAYPMVRNSKSVYYMPNATGPPTRTPSRTPGERGRGRSNSSGCFLDSLETPTPPPPPTSTFSNSTLKHFRAPKPKYKYNGYLPKSEVTDFTTAGPASPTMSTPVPTPPPPPPPSKHFGLAFKKPLHHML
eukprot:03907.XXX_85493_82384_1 [CDS] Oithona nana genome sequencing.